MMPHKLKPKAIFFDSSLWALFHFRRGIIKKLIDTGWDVVIICPKESLDSSLLIPDCQYIYLDVDRTATSIRTLLGAMKSFSLQVQKERPDIVFSYTLKPILISGLVSIISNYQTIMIFAGLGQLLNQSKIKSFFVKIATRIALIKAHKVILSNKDDLTFFSRPLYFRKSLFNILPYGEGLDTKHYSPNLSENKFRRDISFLMIGRLLIEKGVLEFIDAAKNIKKDFPNANFVLCGYFDKNHPSAIDNETINSACQEGLIKFIGTVTDTRPYLNQSKCFVMPSYYNEGMNRSIMDALSMGVPVITTDNRGCRDLIQDGITGFIVKPRNANALCEKMRMMLNMDENDWLAMSSNAQNFAKENLDESLVVATYCRVIQETRSITY